MARIEPLEQRRLLAVSVNWQVAFSYEAGVTPLDAPTRAALETMVKLAGNQWTALIPDNRKAGGAGVTLQVDVDLTSATDGLDGEISASSLREVATNNTLGGVPVFDQGAAARARYGDASSNDGADVQIQINAEYLRSTLWLDPDPSARTSLMPLDKVDAYSAILHEMGHVFFFNGFRDSSTYALLPDPVDGAAEQSAFDTLFTVTSGQPTFTGSSVIGLLGLPINLTRGNPYHVGNALGLGLPQVTDLMNGVQFDRGVRYNITDLDKAIASDVITAGTRKDVVVPPPPEDHGHTQTFTGLFSYTAASGAQVAINIQKGGSGVLTFPSSTLTAQDPSGLTIFGTTKKSVVTFSTSSAATLTAPVTFNTAAGTITSSAVTFADAITIPGVTTLSLGTLSHATLSVGTLLPMSAVTLGSTADSTVTLPATKKLTLGPTSASRLNVGTVAALTAAGFAGDLEVAGNLTKATFAALSGATVSTTGSITTLTVSGGVIRSLVSARTGVITLTTPSFTDSRLIAALAGPPVAYPTSAPAYSSLKVAVKTLKLGAFSNSLVIAPVIGKVTLTSVAVSNAGATFGFFSHTFGTLTSSSAGIAIKKKLLAPFIASDFRVTTA